MLNYSIAMNAIMILLALIGWFLPPPQQAVIVSPQPGSAIMGRVEVIGTVAAEGLSSYEVAFAYQKDTTGTWFPLGEGGQTVNEGKLAEWDTTTINDGIYKLRVVIVYADGKKVETMIQGLRVRNYSPIETPTPAARTSGSEPATATVAMGGDFVPTGAVNAATLQNDAAVDESRVAGALLRGGLAALGLFVLIGIYLGLRGLARRG